MAFARMPSFAYCRGDAHGEVVHRGLRRVIGRVRVAHEADRGERRHVDDRAGASLQHMRQDVLAGQEATGEVEVDGAVPAGLVELDRAAHLGIADVVVQDVDTAVAADHLVDDGLDRVRLRHVADGCFGPAALSRDDPDRLVRGLALDVDADDMGSVAGEQGGGRLAVAPTRPDRAGPEDDRNLVLQPVAHGCRSRSWIRVWPGSAAMPARPARTSARRSRVVMEVSSSSCGSRRTGCRPRTELRGIRWRSRGPRSPPRAPR